MNQCALTRPQMLVALFAPFGVLLRVTLSLLEQAFVGGGSGVLNALGSGYFLANIVGCVCMSFILRFRKSITNVDTALYVGLSTGFCGCVTTFSTWSQRASTLLVRGEVADALLVLFLMHVCSWVSIDCASTLILGVRQKAPGGAAASLPRAARAKSGADRIRAVTLPNNQWRGNGGSGAAVGSSGTGAPVPGARPGARPGVNTDGSPSTVGDVLAALATRPPHPPRRTPSERRPPRAAPPSDKAGLHDSPLALPPAPPPLSSKLAGDLASSLRAVPMGAVPPRSPLAIGRAAYGAAADGSAAPQTLRTETVAKTAGGSGSGGTGGGGRGRSQTDSAANQGAGRSRALSGATYAKGSTKRREKSLGFDFMSEEEHLRYVTRRIQKVKKRERERGEAALAACWCWCWCCLLVLLLLLAAACY